MYSTSLDRPQAGASLHRRRPAAPLGRILAALTAAAGLLLSPPSQAAGGHHAVDDATMLEPGQCQVEAWLEQGRGRQLQHVGPACHVYGLELGLNLDRHTARGEPGLRSAGAQLKWARELQPGLSWGLVWSATWQSASPHHAGQALLLPLSWAPRDDLSLHVNLGRDFHRRAPDRNRHGLAVEWLPTPRWQGLVEYWGDGLQTHHRLGLRHVVNDMLSIDLSRAQPRGQARDAWWSLGLNWALAR